MAFPAIFTKLATDYSQPGAPGLVGQPGSLFEVSSLTHGPDPSDPYGQFKPGGALAPPTLTAIGKAFKGKDTAKTFLTAAFPGLGNLLGGPGAGQTRRKAARQLVEGSPLVLIRRAVLEAMGTVRERDRTAPAIATVARAALRQPDVAQAFATVIGRAQQLGGTGKAQGEEANYIGDVLKWTFGLGTVPEKGAPTTNEILAALAGAAPSTGAATPQPVAPLPAERTLPGSFAGAAPLLPVDATPREALTQLRDFVAGTPAAQEGPVAYLLDSLIGSPQQAGASPFQLPGGMPQGGGVGGMIGNILGGVLGGVLAGGAPVSSAVPILEQARRGIGVPFVDITPSGSSELFEPYRLTPSGARPQVHVQMNPASGKAEFFGPLGRPILFSRDVAVTRRVHRMGRRLATLAGVNRGRSIRRRRGGR